uniref:Transmembrane protein n=1 Tax=Chromera velia CCMP2878 TaxID=1169474 RepID=A0A0G4HGV7_9ALVE|eukprot:Cvel_27423.t1-p1 / transcript=Cvel_27423.t1 / gene=Cvel_27423 / organism=Chromera_velia_CCMP2878 / gene_product=hypothetical protein / transcript_product=hypothetical protein / location=Cvel_scaffold3419:143-5967(+) / protein_length=816 / sequence_SO=supercontig / SO=protein_coding / is_pseudo=false
MEGERGRAYSPRRRGDGGHGGSAGFGGYGGEMMGERGRERERDWGGEGGYVGQSQHRGGMHVGASVAFEEEGEMGWHRRHGGRQQQGEHGSDYHVDGRGGGPHRTSPHHHHSSTERALARSRSRRPDKQQRAATAPRMAQHPLALTKVHAGDELLYSRSLSRTGTRGASQGGARGGAVGDTWASGSYYRERSGDADGRQGGRRRRERERTQANAPRGGRGRREHRRASDTETGDDGMGLEGRGAPGGFGLFGGEERGGHSTSCTKSAKRMLKNVVGMPAGFLLRNREATLNRYVTLTTLVFALLVNGMLFIVQLVQLRDTKIGPSRAAPTTPSGGGDPLSVSGGFSGSSSGHPGPVRNWASLLMEGGRENEKESLRILFVALVLFIPPLCDVLAMVLGFVWLLLGVDNWGRTFVSFVFLSFANSILGLVLRVATAVSSLFVEAAADPSGGGGKGPPGRQERADWGPFLRALLGILAEYAFVFAVKALICIAGNIYIAHCEVADPLMGEENAQADYVSHLLRRGEASVSMIGIGGGDQTAVAATTSTGGSKRPRQAGGFGPIGGRPPTAGASSGPQVGMGGGVQGGMSRVPSALGGHSAGMQGDSPFTEKREARMLGGIHGDTSPDGRGTHLSPGPGASRTHLSSQRGGGGTGSRRGDGPPLLFDETPAATPSRTGDDSHSHRVHAGVPGSGGASGAMGPRGDRRDSDTLSTRGGVPPSVGNRLAGFGRTPSPSGPIPASPHSVATRDLILDGGVGEDDRGMGGPRDRRSSSAGTTRELTAPSVAGSTGPGGAPSEKFSHAGTASFGTFNRDPPPPP